MRKVLFGTLCASALLAACSQDELMTVTPENGEGEKIEVTLGATFSGFEDEAGTRMTLVGTDWGWVKGDMLGACKVGTYDGTTASATVSSNYPFFLTEEPETPVKNASFKTNTAVFAGLYVFYHQYNGKLVGSAESKDDVFEVTYPAVQNIDPENPTAHVASLNTWVSPIIKLGGIEYDAENETAIEFTPLNGVLKLNIKNSSTDGALVINKVEVNGFNLPQSGNLDFATNTKFQVLDASASAYANNLESAVKKMRSVNKTSGVADLLATGAAAAGTKISAVVTGDGFNVAAGGEVAVYVLIPGGTYAIDSEKNTGAAIKSFTVYTNKGKFDINAEDARSGNNKGNKVDALEFNRNALLNLYPVLEGKAAPVTKYEINGIDDWNNAVAYALANRNAKIEFDLLEDIAINELPACPIYVTSTDKKLTLNEGKTFTPVANSYFAEIENKGTLNLLDNLYIGKLVNKSVVNVAATEEVVGVAAKSYDGTAASYKGVSTLENQGTINLNGEMINGVAGNWKNTAEVQNTSTLGTIKINNGGKLTVSEALTNAGKIENAGNISLAAALTNEGEIDVTTATGKVLSSAPKTGNIVNNGTINLDAAVDVFLNASDGKANDVKFVADASTGIVAVTIDPAGVTSTLPAIEEISCVTMSGAWNQKLLKTLTSQWTGIKAQIWNGVTLDVEDITTELSSVAEIEVNGTSAISNSSTTAVNLNADLTVKGDLTVGENVTVGKEAATSPVVTVLGSMVNNGEVYANLTVGADKNGSTPANTTAKYTNADKAETSVVSGYENNAYAYGFLTLYGTFVNESAASDVNVKSVLHKIQGKSTFTGEYTTQQ